jgi:anti-anti-sigma factor
MTLIQSVSAQDVPTGIHSAFTAAQRPLTIRTAHRQGVYVVAPYGELDLATVPEVQRELDRAERSDAAEIVLDLGGLTFIDSTGIRMVLHADARSRADGNRLRLLAGRDRVHKLFALCGLVDRLPFVATP